MHGEILTKEQTELLPIISEFSKDFGLVGGTAIALHIGHRESKVYALGHRPKWKDHVDLYFIMKDFHKIQEIVEEAKKIYGNEFNERMFRSQLSYFDDMDYREEVVWKNLFETNEEEIKKALIEFSLS